MAEKQALNATFFAFRKRERGGVLTGATLAFGLLSLLTFGVFAFFNWRAVGDYLLWISSISAQSGANPGDPAAVQAMMPPASVMGLGPAYFLLSLFFYVLLASYEAACLRWLARGETGGFFGLSLGADTWRVYLGYWLWLFLLMGFYFGGVIAGVLVGVAVGLLAAQLGGDAATPLMLLAPLVVIVCVLGPMIYFGVRFAPAAATSIALKRFAFFDAWKVTKGRFWGLIGAFLIVFLIYCVAIFVWYAVMIGIIGFNVFRQMQAGTEGQQQFFALLSSPAVWIPIAVLYAVMLVVAGVFYVALFGINARAVIAAAEDGKIDGVNAETLAKTFN